MSMIIDGSLGTTFNDGSLQPSAASPFGLKNRIINGDMVINQRNLGTVNPVSGDSLKYTIDRFWVYNSTASSKFSVQQSSTAPAGFINSALITVTNAYTPTGGEEFEIGQNIEGVNISDLAWGTADAKTVTLSFWVRSSLTGTFGGSLVNSAYNRSYPFSYTISSANTWEQKSITIAGDTSGTWLTTNGVGIRLVLSLGVGSTKTTTAGAWTAGEYYNTTGSVNLVATSGATWYITGVQLERNTTATPFEWLPYSTELALCQRYYELCIGGVMTSINTNSGYIGGITNFIVAKRATPTVTRVSDINVDLVNTPFSEQITINGFRAAAQVTTSSGAKFITLYKAEIEL